MGGNRECIPVPTHLIQEVVYLKKRKPVCTFWRNGWCRAGKRCKLLHGESNAAEAVTLPHTTRYRTDTGKEVLMLRPPLTEALQKLFEEHGKVNVLCGSKLHDFNGMQVVTFQLAHMKQRDHVAVDSAKLTRGVKITDSDGTWKANPGVSSAAPFALPCYAGHGTSVKNGLGILLSGSCNPSDGIAGRGIYAFAAAKHDLNDLKKLWERTAVGGYNTGCLVVCHIDGIAIKGCGKYDVPQGAVAFKNDQLAISPTCCEYSSICFAANSLVSELSTQLDRVGFTQRMYNGLKQIQLHLHNSSTSDEKDVTLISNTVVSKPSKRSNT